MLTDVGQIFGKEKEAQAWLDQWDKKVATAKEELKGLIDTSSTFTVMDFFDKNIFLYGNNFGRGGELVYRALGFLLLQRFKKTLSIKKAGLGYLRKLFQNTLATMCLLTSMIKQKKLHLSKKVIFGKIYLL